jgi:hypothetical protein
VHPAALVKEAVCFLEGKNEVLSFSNVQFGEAGQAPQLTFELHAAGTGPARADAVEAAPPAFGPKPKMNPTLPFHRTLKGSLRRFWARADSGRYLQRAEAERMGEAAYALWLKPRRPSSGSPSASTAPPSRTLENTFLSK